MIKKLTAVLTALVISLQTIPVYAIGEYYTHLDLPRVTETDLVYTGTDISELKKNISSIENLLKKKGNEERILLTAEKCFSVYTDANYQYAIATLAYDRNCSRENLENLNEITDISLEVSEILSKLIYHIYYSDEYSTLLEVMFGDMETALNFALPEDEDIVGLLEKEEELKVEYSKVYGDSDACADLFAELVVVRNEIATRMGYDNYAEYADAEIYGREYSDEERAEFYSAVKEYFVPLYEKAILAYLISAGTDVPMDEDEVLLKARKTVMNINPELGEAFDYLIANNIYDIRPRDNKNPSAGAYTLFIPKLNIPYIYINPKEDYEQNGINTITTLIHEFGHFASTLYTPEMMFSDAPAFMAPSVETAEIHSQGLEVLSERYYGDMFGSNATMMRYYLISSILSSVIDGCLFNEWQEQVYAMENPTVESFNSLFVSLIGEYYGKCTPEEAQKMWTEVHHNYQLPMYYMSYAISGATVLGLYSESIDDYAGAVDKYMCISAEGIYRSFAEIVDVCRLYDIFDQSVMADIAESTADAFAIGYSDISAGAWYSPYIYVVSNIMDGRTDDEFMPDSAVTRSEFVGALGKMYDYYIGIDEEYENNFEDAKTDKNGKYIAWASERGIAEGYDDNTFGADDTLTREQAAVFIHRLSGAIDGEVREAGFSDDCEISEWAKAATVWTVQNGIVDGRDNGEFDPKMSITRAETAKIISCYIYNAY